MTELEQALVELEQKQFPVEVIQELKSGKEAKVYITRSTQSNELFALKLYHDYKTRAFQTQKTYLQDRYIGSEHSSIRHAIKKGNTVGKEFMQTGWVMREQYFLKTLADQSDYIPKMKKPLKNGSLMEFIGDETGSAPRLSEIKLPKTRHQEVADILIHLIELFLANGIVHGDLSAFNILWWHNKPYVIDFPQAIDIRESKRVPELLKRDVKNTLAYFSWDNEETVREITDGLIEKYQIARW